MENINSNNINIITLYLYPSDPLQSSYLIMHTPVCVNTYTNIMITLDTLSPVYVLITLDTLSPVYVRPTLYK